jgi:drug/metabolite transporter (DMT)-like permease
MSELLLFLAAILFSTGGAAIKACSLTNWQIAGFRSGVAAVTLWALVPEARRGWTLRTAGVGTTYAATLVLFVLATRMTTSAHAIYLQSTAPLYLLLLGPLVLRERIRPVDIVVMAAVAFGALLLFLGVPAPVVTAPAPGKGNVLAAASGLTWALTLTGLRWTGKRDDSESPLGMVTLGNFIAFAFCLPLAIPVRSITFPDILVIVYLGVFQIGLAYVALTRSIRVVPALEAATLLLVEPVFNPIWTWVVHRERPGKLAIIGGFVIIATTFGATLWRNTREREQVANGASTRIVGSVK